MINLPPAFIIRTTRYNQLQIVYESLKEYHPGLKLKKFNRYQSSFLTEKYEFIGIISISDQDHDDLMVSLISKNSNAFDFFKTKRSFILLKATRDRLKLLQIIT